MISQIFTIIVFKLPVWLVFFKVFFNQQFQFQLYDAAIFIININLVFIIITKFKKFIDLNLTIILFF